MVVSEQARALASAAVQVVVLVPVLAVVSVQGQVLGLAMAQAVDSLDLIIDTVPVKHDINIYLPLLDIDGTICLVGQIGPEPEFDSMPLVFGRRRISGSPIGGIAETQELLNFCAKMNVLPDCEMINIQDINTAYARLAKSDVKYRFVIDMASLKME